MRIIGGEFRSRRLKSPEGLATRPTPDRLRESLFNILAPVIAGALFVDAYAGCGSVGLEALSRDARHVVFIERSRPALKTLEENVRTFDAESRVRVIAGNAGTFLKAQAADIVFIDPPYEAEQEYEVAMLAATAKLVVAQHASRFILADRYGQLERYRTVRQGDNSLSFFRRAAE